MCFSPLFYNAQFTIINTSYSIEQEKSKYYGYSVDYATNANAEHELLFLIVDIIVLFPVFTYLLLTWASNITAHGHHNSKIKCHVSLIQPFNLALAYDQLRSMSGFNTWTLDKNHIFGDFTDGNPNKTTSTYSFDTNEVCQTGDTMPTLTT